MDSQRPVIARFVLYIYPVGMLLLLLPLLQSVSEKTLLIAGIIQ